MRFAIWAPVVCTLLVPAPAAATQGHGGPEGLYVHQLSHIFFCLSMGILIYWLRAMKLTRKPGWRYIGYSALLFILWSADAFTVHLLDEQLLLVTGERVGAWTFQIHTEPAGSPLGIIYYLAKLDHLLCFPAMVCLYLGLKRLSAGGTDEPTAGDSS
jgi:hypothetical protein